jgi:hypothetical protein
MKTQTQHTPGPWAIHERAKDSRAHISNGAHIVCTLGTTRTDGSPNHTPNARLIASAPDLLDALQVCIDSFEEMIGISDFGSPTESDFPLKQAREAIRKAKGEA